ncbi:TRPM8 channel-associated factor 3-like [Mytilus trossulus]|uniref:TRPM8 channel-associated factor 3-like n=1 Tax=Mytilus trossulus TaxID=6551 RepID=UPI0030063ABF
MKDWKREILDGVDMVSFPGCVPGVIFVYGENSQAILANKRGHVLCAAAEYGKGRIIVFSHNVFVNSFGMKETKRKNNRFNENIRNWITKNTDKGNEIPCFSDYLNNFDELPPECRIITWNGLPVRTDDNSLLKLLDWVERGGGLICGVCPWGFAEVYKIDVESIPLNIIFRAIGIAYAGKLMYKNDSDLAELLVKDNMADYAKPSDLVSAINKHPEKINRLGGLIHNVVHLPEELYIKHKPHVVEMIQKLSPDNDHIPTRSKPVESHGAKKAAMLTCDIMIRDGLEGNVVLAEGIHEFPGTFVNTPEVQSIELEFSSQTHKFHSTGCYLPAGTIMELSWSKTKKPWNIIIGLHGDELYNTDSRLRRWPKIRIKKELKTKELGNFSSTLLNICSPFGGLIYLQSPKSTKDKLQLKLHNVVPAPIFTYKTADTWETVERYKPGLWCDIIGDKIALTLPSASVRQLSDPTMTMKVWDSVVSAHIDLLGKDPSNGRGQWVVTDEQPSIGYMHSGYPIVTHLDMADPNKIYEDCFLLSRDHILNVNNRKGSWGMFHELGHNFQDSMWTWAGTKEVTCNIFTLHAMDVVCNVKPWDHLWVREKFENASNYLREGTKYAKLCSNPGIALLVYAQLARDFGWAAYKSVFRTYDKLPKDKRPSNQQEKENMWIQTFSNVVKRNLSLVFEFWGWPIRGLDDLKKFPPYLPDDVTTREFAKDRATTILKKYENNSSGACPTQKPAHTDNAYCPGKGGYYKIDQCDVKGNSVKEDDNDNSSSSCSVL